MILDVQSQVQRMIDAGKSLQEVLAVNLTAPYDAQVPGGTDVSFGATSADRFCQHGLCGASPARPVSRGARYPCTVAGTGMDLNLWRRQLGHVPDTVWQQTDLETLVLADNALTELSECIESLTRLRMLDLGHNQLTRVPDAIGNLESLTDFLYLHDNRLTWLPESFGRLTRLRYLNISQNAFTTFPEPVCGMVGLVELRAEGNQLEWLPESVGQLAELRELSLRDNRLSRLPEALGRLSELRQLDLRGNPLTDLPDAFAALPRLEKLDLRWVATLMPPPWLRDLEQRGCRVYR